MGGVLAGLIGSLRGAAVGDFVLLETQVLGSLASSITFSGLATYASTYRHLQIRAVVRTNINAVNDTVIMRVNGNSSSASYRSHSLVGTGGVVVSEDYSTLTGIFAAQALGATAAASSYDAVVLDILDAFSTTKNKTTRRLSGNPNVPRVWLTSGVWLSTSSITSLDILSNSAASFTAGSRFSLYGIKG